jgi:3-hydroxybutyryl-CoA dehydrogenase
MEIRRLGVVGAGTMGHGIAQVSAQAGFETVLFDVTRELADKGLARIAGNLDQGIAKGKVKPEEKAQVLGRLSPVASLDALAGCQLVIEAAPEDMALKKATFQKLAAVCGDGCILASNTSSLSVTEMAAAVPRPERVVGTHFFNPVHIMKLLEVIRAFQTSDETVQAVRQVGERMGKQLIEVKDSPGFATTRLGVLLGMEAIRMVEEGVASPEDIDRAMELGYGYPMGPLKLGDLVGLDVRLAIGEYLYAELGNPAFRPPQLLKKMVRAGKLGKKSGQGFYRY